MALEQFIIVTFLFPLFILLHMLGCRLYKGNHTITLMFLSFFLFLSLWLFIYFLYYPYNIVSFLTGLCLIGFWCLSYMEYFSMLCRGFSLTILVDLFKKPKLTEKAIMENYGEGKGVDWLFEKRLQSLDNLNFIQRDSKSIRLKGRISILIANCGLIFKKVLKLGAGG